MLAWTRGSSFLHSVQTGFGDHPASYLMGAVGYFPRDKADGAQSWPFFSIYGQATCHPPLINNSIHRHSHNISRYLNYCRYRVIWWSPMSANNKIFTSSVTSASHSGSAVLQSYKCSISFTIFCDFLIHLVKLWTLKWEAKQMLKLGSLINDW